MINFLEELEEKFKIPLYESSQGFRIVYLINGLFLEGHIGLSLLSDSEIVFKLKKGKISISGNNLQIIRLDKDCAIVKGIIIKLEREADNG